MEIHEERRRAPRITARVPISVTDETTPYAAEAENLSASGVYCTIARFVSPMTKLELRFELPDGHAVRCTGVVVRSQPSINSEDRAVYQLAILFTELSGDDRSAINRFVQQRLATNIVH